LCVDVTLTLLLKVCIWDLESGAAVASLEGHQGGILHDCPHFSCILHCAGAVLAVAANPDPSRHQLASAGIDATVKLWEVQSEMEM
jgi:WD40 repeat protein